MTKGLHNNSLRKVDNPHQWMIDDAMMELIQQIKAEVERRKKYLIPQKGQGVVLCEEIRKQLDSLLSFLSDLESEKQMEHKDIDTEIGHWMSCLDDKYCMLVNHYSIQDIKDTARHFYELGRQSKAKVSEELETEALCSAGVLLSEHFEDEDDDAIRTTALRCWKGGVIHGASWQKEQMMKDAVEGEVVKDINNRLAVTAKNVNLDKFKFGDKVRVIVCKKEE